MFLKDVLSFFPCILNHFFKAQKTTLCKMSRLSNNRFVRCHYSSAVIHQELTKPTPPPMAPMALVGLTTWHFIETMAPWNSRGKFSAGNEKDRNRKWKMGKLHILTFDELLVTLPLISIWTVKLSNHLKGVNSSLCFLDILAWIKTFFEAEFWCLSNHGSRFGTFCLVRRFNLHFSK